MFIALLSCEQLGYTLSEIKSENRPYIIGIFCDKPEQSVPC